MKLCLKCSEVFSSQAWICPACGYEPTKLNDVLVHSPEFANEGGGFKPEYFSELSRLESTNFWFKARNDLILWALRAYRPDVRSFLEVGCGTGFVLSGIAEVFPDVSLTGSEIFLTGLSHAAKRVPRAGFMQMDARHIPFVHEFDAIGAFDVLEHIEADEAVLAQLHKALKPQGILLLTVPQHQWLWSASDDYACHVRRYSSKEIDSKVRSAGFQILRSSSFVTLLLPLMMLSRMRQKSGAGEFVAEDEFKIHPFLNKILYSLMSIEQTPIRLGFNYPAGGSRLIVARKET